ncbi:isochorismatase family cysteine hydrolase [Nocardioides terrisoli]|uniref:isochorismatase family cysteine hydrolase n=1 Tax=Nocardioides terrisoli TaxID=3388267 RepID=UPI00287B8406|nr:isochorismatase family cysteine hydrolase [Nocardioides marmorisolisilvae]
MITREAWNQIMKRGRTINNHADLDPRRCALLVVDLQQGFTLDTYPFGLPRTQALIPLANAMSASVRAAGGQVFFLRHTYAESGPRALPPWQLASPIIHALSDELRVGNAAHNLHPDLDLSDHDEVVDKYRYSPFARNSSSLDDVLAERGCDSLIIMGCAANTCCEATARDAYQLGYKTLYLSDGNAAATEEEELASMMNIASVAADVRTSSEVRAMLLAATAAS